MIETGNPVFVWEPLTPPGVAAFAHAKLRRLLAVQFIVALLVAASVVWFLADSICPVVKTAIQNLPDTGEIRGAQLNWHGASSQMLSQGRVLALDVDLNHSGGTDHTSDLQIEFGRDDVWISGLLGYVEVPYPGGVVISFNRLELAPSWGAWEAEILFGTGAFVVVALFISWWLLSTLYFVPVWLLGFFANRDLNFRRSWKLSGAALMPGALLMAAGVLLYDFGAVDLVQLGFIFGAHLLLGWIYLFVSLLFVPAIATGAPRGNPFTPRN